MAARNMQKMGLTILFFIGLLARSVDSSCRDLDSRCRHWADRGECTNSVEFMRRNCQLSCRHCPEAVLEDLLVDAAIQTKYLAAMLGIVLTAIALAWVKVYFAGGSCKSLAKLKGKTVIVTGANTGIGLDTALSFAGRGAKVIIACRSYKSGLKALKYIRDLSENRFVEFRKLDLSSFDSIREFAKEFNTEEDRLDVLVNNAGVLTSAKRQVTKDGHEEMFQVNHLGPFLLTNLLLPKMKKSSPSRIVNVSCGIHKKSKGLNFKDLEMKEKFGRFKQFAQTKLASLLFTHELSKKLEGTSVTANSINPGYIMSEAYRNVGILHWKIAKLIIYPFMFIFWKSTRQGAQTSIRVAVDPVLEKVTGKYFEDCLECDVGPFGKDDGAAKKLWEISERLTGLNK